MEFSEKQKQLIEQFRELVKDDLPVEYDEWFLVRWLKARNFNLKNAEKMFRASMKWRRENDIDHIDTWQMPEVLVKYMPGGHFGFDKEGAPIWYDLAPLLDWRGLVRSVKKRDNLKGLAHRMELLTKSAVQQTRKLGKPITQAVFVMDLEQLGTRHLNKDCVDTFNAFMAQNEANYPEYAKYIFIVNAPKIFPMVYSLARPFLSEDTKKKVKVLGSNYKEVLRQYIDGDQLPAYLGGTATGPDGDTHCCHVIKQGGEIPHTYYAKGSMKSEGQNKATINHGQNLQLEFNIQVPGSILKWSFETKTYDLAFGVFRKEKSDSKLSDMTPVVPLNRTNSQFVPEDGFYTCQQPGNYVFVFDNSYSWMHNKQVHYLVEVLDPYGNAQDPVNQQLENMTLTDNADDNRNLTTKDDLVDVPIQEKSN